VTEERKWGLEKAAGSSYERLRGSLGEIGGKKECEGKGQSVEVL